MMSKAITDAKAFLKDGDAFESIVNMCSLKPITWQNWHDVDKNLLKIHKNNAIHIYPAKHHVPIKKDYKARPATIAKNSRWTMMAFGQDIFGNEATLIWMLGNDNKLKLSFFVEECWVENYLPLLSGIDILKLINKEKDSDFKKIKIPKIMNIKIEESYVVPWPPNKKQIEKLEKCQDSVEKVLQGCGI